MKEYFLNTWGGISIISRNKLIRSSYIWLLIVPLVYKVFEKIEFPFAIVFQGTGFELNLDIPFNWKIFFISSVIISVANVIYYISCPKMIKDFKHYGEFKEKGHSMSYFINEGLDYNSKELTGHFTGISHAFVGKIGTLLERKQMFLPDFYDEKDGSAKERAIEIVFWYNYTLQENKQKKLRVVLNILYLSGIILFGLVAIQNIWFALNQII